MLNKLLANAARHSPETAPIRISAAREGLHLSVSTSDEGEGIAPERLTRLFRKYPAAGDGERGVGDGRDTTPMPIVGGAAGFGLGFAGSNWSRRRRPVAVAAQGSLNEP